MDGAGLDLNLIWFLRILFFFLDAPSLLHFRSLPHHTHSAWKRDQRLLWVPPTEFDKHFFKEKLQEKTNVEVCESGSSW